MNTIRYLACALALTAGIVSAQPQESRADALKRKFMAPCCWSETLDQHKSPTTSELNAEIDKWVAAGLSDQEIEARLVERYGRRILAEPGGAQGKLLRAAPFVVLGAGAVWVVFLLRRWMRPRPTVGSPGSTTV